MKAWHLWISFVLHLLLGYGILQSSSQEFRTSDLSVQIVIYRGDQDDMGKPKLKSENVKQKNFNAQIKKKEYESKIAKKQTANTPRDEEFNSDVSVLGRDFGLHAHYPRISRVLEESGEVIIAVEDQQAFILKTSGHPRLDASALETVRSALKNDLLRRSVEINSRLSIRFVFRLIPENH